MQWLPLVATLALACGARSELIAFEQDSSMPEEAAVSSCSSSNCAGCCDESGACQPGDTVEACGIGGSPCRACNPLRTVCNPLGGGSHVEGVVCWAPCDLVKGCAGGCCPANGDCLSGTADDACGEGTVCQNCAAMGKSCVAMGITRGCM